MLVYLAVLAPVLVLFCGIAVDVSMLQMNKLRMQSASDAAAMAAELEIERNTGNYATAAQSDASLNGFVNGTSSTVITTAMRPTTGSYANFYDAVQVSISAPINTLFLRLLGTSATTVKTQSVALVTPCMYMMGTNGLATNELKATSSTIASTCPYYINDSASIDAASTFSGAGENITGAAGSSTWSASTTTPPRYGAKVQTDPLSAIVQPAQPAAGNCAVTGNTTISGDYTVGPGTYCDNLVIQNGNITLYPGLYVIAGSLSIQGCTFNTPMGGVTFFFTKDPNTGSYGKLSITSYPTSGGASARLSILNSYAPANTSSGAVPGILFMTDRSYTHTAAQDFIIDQSTTINGDGIWYLSGTGMSLATSSKFQPTNYGGVVADNLLIQNSTFKSASNFSNVSGGNPFRPLGGLVE